MKNLSIKRLILLTLTVTAGSVLAQQTASRILKFDTKAQVSGDLRNGPYNYAGVGSQPVKASVGTINISAPKAVLSGPAGQSIASAEGKRSAAFSGGVGVTRGRLTAKGATLDYSETTGQGVLKGSPSAIFAPEKQGDDPVNITAQQMSLDVDTNMSDSTGSVKLQSGTQSGASNRLVFDEKRELGVLTGAVSLNRAASGKQKEINMGGDEARILTKNKLIYVKNKVKLTQGDVTTTGDSMFYDDKKNLAYVIGNAVSVDAKNKTTLRGKVLEQRTDLARVRVLTTAPTVDLGQFKLTGEK